MKTGGLLDQVHILANIEKGENTKKRKNTRDHFGYNYSAIDVWKSRCFVTCHAFIGKIL